MSNVMFTCTRLAGIQKKGILVPDANGYYRQPVGALKVFNSAGHYYTGDDAAVDIFRNRSSGFMRRVERAAVRGEVDHPEWPKGMSEAEYEARMYYIDPKNTCVHFANFELDFDNYRDKDGRPMIAIIGYFTPSGVHGGMLEKQLKNGLENVCFSIRAFTIDRYVGGVRQRTLAEVVTFDYVNEPGIWMAEKYQERLALESVHEHVVTRHGLQKAMDRQVLHLGRESVTLDSQALFKSLGWKEPEGPGFLAGRW